MDTHQKPPWKLLTEKKEEVFFTNWILYLKPVGLGPLLTGPLPSLGTFLVKVVAMNAFSNMSLDLGFITVLANSSHKKGNCINLTVLVLTMWVSFCNQSISWGVYGLHVVIAFLPAAVLKTFVEASSWWRQIPWLWCSHKLASLCICNTLHICCLSLEIMSEVYGSGHSFETRKYLHHSSLINCCH